MATLKAMFKLFDGYSTTVEKINRKTNEATNKILKASGATDSFNTKLQATGASAGIASGGIGKLVGALVSLVALKKGMDITDEYINTNARLNLINDGLQTQAELQEKIFASADRAKGAYSGMASAISKMGLLAADSFGSNDELIAFTELIQKSFKVGGASATEQSSALLQLTQAMGSGRLQGDEFRSIMENAPMIADAIAKYTGKSKGELKEMSSEGLITSSIIKNAMFAMSDDINAKFETMPMTFANVWNKIKNGGTKAFSSIMESVNKLINTEGFQEFIDGVVTGFNVLAKAVGWLIDNIVSNWDIIQPILVLIGSVLLGIIIAQLWAMVPPLITQAAAWLAINWPILLVVAAIGLLLFLLVKLGVGADQIVGGITGTFYVLFAFIYNSVAFVWNTVLAFAEFLANLFVDPLYAIQKLFYDVLIKNVVGFFGTLINFIIDGINLINEKISELMGTSVNLIARFDTSMVDDWAPTSNKDVYDFSDLRMEEKDYSEAFVTGYEKGSVLVQSVSDLVGGFDLSEFGTSNNPLTIQGTGSGGKIEVDMSDEDLQYLRDVAERDYVAKIASNTLAPNVTIQFGDVHETADADKIAGRIRTILQEEIAMASEGVYA